MHNPILDIPDYKNTNYGLDTEVLGPTGEKEPLLFEALNIEEKKESINSYNPPDLRGSGGRSLAHISLASSA